MAPQTHGEQARPSLPRNCDLDVYVLLDGDLAPAVESNPSRPRSNSSRANSLPRIAVVSRLEDGHATSRPVAVPAPPAVAVAATSAQEGNDDDGMIGSRTRRVASADELFGGGLCRHLAAMYTDVGMTTVERVRWLCGSMLLAYLLATLALFAWPLYLVPMMGLLTGVVGLCACRRPHERRYLSYVFTFLALNFAQMLLLVWVLLATLTAELTTAICESVCLGAEVGVIFTVALVLALLLLHYRAHQLTRYYVREFRMIEQLAIRGRRPQYSTGGVATSLASSSTMATEVSRASSSSNQRSAVAVTIQHDAYESHRAPPVAYSTADHSHPAATRL